MYRIGWLGFLACLAAAIVAWARIGTVTTTDGRLLTGEVQNGPDGKTVSVTIRGSTLTIPKTDVIAVNYPEDADADFRERLSLLDSTDVKGRLQLSQAELNQKQYDLALEAARDAQAIDPHNPDAAILIDTIQSERSLDDKLVNPTSQPAATPETSVKTPRYLSEADVQKIRRAELRPDDNVRVQFYNNVRERYLKLHGNATDFYAETPAQQALDILQTGDGKLIADVNIASDPQVLLVYRTEVQPRILSGCAAANCHGGSAARFFLYPGARDVLPAYTNFYILEQSGRKIEGGDEFGKGAVYRPMIDRVHPEASLILQFGLPPLAATTPHPKVKDYSPIYLGTDGSNYQNVLKWIETLTPIPPNYGIKFKLPSTRPAE